MNKTVIGLLAPLMLSGPALAIEPYNYVIIDYSKVDAHQYCLYQGQIYTRGVRIKTDTGTYSCRLPDTKQSGQEEEKNLLSWVLETAP